MRLARWGNSTGVRIPAALLSAASLKRGDQVVLRLLDSGEIRIRPLDSRKLIPVDTADVVTVDDGTTDEW
jgi:antitoxin MazE